MSGFARGVRALVYGSGFVAVWVLAAAMVRRWDPWLGDPLPIWVVPVGGMLVLGGAPLGIWCVVLFVLRGQGTPAPFDAPRVFVAEGPYRWVRNPMYVGGIAVLVGAGLILRSLSVAALGVVAWGLTHLFVVFYEEPTLTRLFGDEYRRYRSRVFRWWPVPRQTGGPV